LNSTEDIMERDCHLTLHAYGGGLYHSFRQNDCPYVSFPSGIDTEEGEFLYGLVKILKPKFVLETGTNMGISTRYIALGLLHNGFGCVDTIEHNTTVYEAASKKLQESGFGSVVNCISGKVEDYTPSCAIDLAWLDSEPQTRYAELVRFFGSMQNRGIFAIHDLRWPNSNPDFGVVPPKMQKWLDSGELQVVSFWTYHNVTIFQKVVKE
jgi:predicted O-methyltransferase YrrM